MRRRVPDWSFPPLVAGAFVDRPNRFLIHARVGASLVAAASRDPGRLGELLLPGASVLLCPSGTTVGPSARPRTLAAAKEATSRRKTAYTLTLVRYGTVWVCLVPALANRILEVALGRDGVEGLSGARVLGREVRCGESRLDFLLRHRGRDLLTEVKSATLVERGRALFPDAPTSRGARHLRELTAARRRGRAAQVVFVVQRPDADSLSPHRDRDPEFGRALDGAARAGVQLRAYACRVSPAGCALDRAIPVVL